MALPSYAYLQLKMPGTNGTITAHGSPEKAFEAELTNVELAEAALASADLEQIKRSIDTTTTTLSANPRPGPVFQPAKDTKKFEVHPDDPKKMMTIGGDLSEEQEAELLQFLGANWNIFAWKPADMLGVRQESATQPQHLQRHKAD